MRSFVNRLIHDGYLQIGKWLGTPIRLHWTALPGALLYGHFRWAPALWFAFIVLIALHEIGHAFFVRRYGAIPVSLDIHGLGGLCRWQGSVTPIEGAAIAWGGVVAQFVVCVISLVGLAVFGQPSTPAMVDLRQALIEQNLFLIGLNLLPFPPLDGSKAWQLPGLLLAQRSARKREQAKKRAVARRGTIRHLRLLDRAESDVRNARADVDEILKNALEKNRTPDESPKE